VCDHSAEGACYRMVPDQSSLLCGAGIGLHPTSYVSGELGGGGGGSL
jgi:hypothetical protein